MKTVLRRSERHVRSPRARAKTLARLLTVVSLFGALAAIAAGSASADLVLPPFGFTPPRDAGFDGGVPDGRLSPPFETLGWYVRSNVAGSILLGVVDPDRQASRNITCRQSTDNAIVGSFAGQSDDFWPFSQTSGHGVARVGIVVTGENPDILDGILGVYVTCTGTLLQRDLNCFLGVCFPGPWDEVGTVTWHAGPWMIDRSSPIDVTLTAERGPNANGWYNAPAFVRITASDFRSGIHHCTINGTTLSLGPWPPDLNPALEGYFGAPNFDAEAQATPRGVQAIGPPDGTSKGIQGTCFDWAGNLPTDTGLGYNYDASDPTLAPTISPGSTLVRGASATASPHAVDVGPSGIDTASCDPVDTSTLGAHTVSCTATDKAGNTATASATYKVGFGFTGFRAPVDNDALNVAKAGQAVPLKF